ncbi:MAG: iron ABC transporter permease [Candidatus Brocadiaceae bacterium]|nr:iron ABC transporter permease [Candidatus Brocadiaceae bacterium]
MTFFRKDLVFYAMPLIFIAASMFVGSSDIAAPKETIRWLFCRHSNGSSNTNNDMLYTIIVDVRLPRTLLAFAVGGSLAIAGNSIQNVLRTPLVDSFILGISSGAAFGAALSLALLNDFSVQPVAFLFGMLAVALTYFLSLTKRGVSLLSLILAGIIVSGFFTSLLAFVQYITDPFKLQSIVHWMIGNLHYATWSKVRSCIIPIIIGTAWLLIMRWRMNVIALGDEESLAVGLNPTVERLLIIIPAALVSSSTVSVAGIIPMVGLIIPHIVRLVFGVDNRRNQPLSFVIGGSFLLFVDTLSRSITDVEMPVGIFTTIVGGPVFVYLLKSGRMREENL